MTLIVGLLVGAEELPLSAPALAVVISAFTAATGLFIRSMFRANKVVDRSTAMVIALHEYQHAEDVQEAQALKLEIAEQREHHVREIAYERDDKRRLSEECQRIRDERDHLAIENARLRRSGPPSKK